MKKRKKEKINSREEMKSQLIIIGSLFVLICCIFCIFYKVYNEHNLDTINEKLLIDFFDEQQENLSIDITNSELENESNQDEIVVETKKEENKIQNTEKYLGVLEIKKINLKQGFYSKNSKNNNVNKHIKVLDESDMPNIEKGNLIIAGHSGNAYISYFKYLNKLEKGDNAIVYYQSKKYSYSLVNSYEIEKNGTAHIIRNSNKNTLTLITCKHNTNKQLVFIFELKEVM